MKINVHETGKSGLHRQTPVEAGTVKPTSLAMRIAMRLPFGLMRLWLYFLIVFALAGMIASTLANQNDKKTYTVEGTLVYNPIPMPAQAVGLYQPPDLKTMVTFAKAPETLQKVTDDLELGVPVPVLAMMLEVIDPKMRQGIVCQLKREDPEQGEKILDRFMELFPQHIAEMRRQKVLGYIEDLDHAVVSNKTRLAAAQSKLAEHYEHLGAVDAATEHDRLLRQYEADEAIVTANERANTAARGTLEEIEKRLKQLRDEVQREAEKSKEDAAQQESLTAQRLRQNRLLELINERRFQIQVQAQIDVKQEEYERALKLYENDFVSLSRVQKLEADLRTLIAKVEHDEQIEAWRAELKRIDKDVVPSATVKPKTSPIITRILGRKFDLELGIKEKITQANQAKLAIAIARKKIHSYQLMQKQTVNLQKDLDVIKDERETLENQLSALRKIASYGPREFSIVSNATGLMYSPSSGKKKTFILVFGGLVFLLCAPVFVLELLKALKTRVFDKFHDIGLLDLWPMRPRRTGFLQRTVGSFTTLAEQWAQLVALRLQQLCRKRGSVLMFTPVQNDRKDVLLITRVAQYLALRDERVAILSTTNDMDSRTAFEEAIRSMGREALADDGNSQSESAANLSVGLSEYLRLECSQVNEIVRPSPTRGIDFVTAGQKQTPIDLMTGSQMCQVINHLQTHYTMVLIAGPPLSETIDLEVQARHTDGVLFLLDDAELLSSQMRYSLQSLQELDSERLWGMARRPPRIFDTEMPGNKRGGLTVRILLPLARGICRRGVTLAGALLRRSKPKVSTDGEAAEALPTKTDSTSDSTAAADAAALRLSGYGRVAVERRGTSGPSQCQPHRGRDRRRLTDSAEIRNGDSMKIGYFIPEFPGQTHAFFWREMQAFQELNVKPDVVSTRRPGAGVAAHDWAITVEARTTYLIPLSLGVLFAAGFEILRAGPAGWFRVVQALCARSDVTIKQRLKLVPLAFMGAVLSSVARRRDWKQIHVHSCANAANVAMFANRLSGVGYSLTLHGPLKDYGLRHRHLSKAARTNRQIPRLRSIRLLLPATGRRPD